MTGGFMLHRDSVTPELFEILKILSSASALKSFRLVGGTAISLQLGHRRSVDIDFFSNEKFDKLILRKTIQSLFPKTEIFLTEHNLLAEINTVRVELYDDWLLPFKKPCIEVEGIRLTALEDLAAFKLSAITGRREKKDYIDLFVLFKKLGSANILNTFQSYDPLLSPKSILFALNEVTTALENKSPMPEMLMAIDWNEIKNDMLSASRQFNEFIQRNRSKN
jgi:hypothetical protein